MEHLIGKEWIFVICSSPWWRHQMETFSVLLALCVGNSPVTSKFAAQRPVTWSFDVFFDLCLNLLWSKQSWGWWFETPSHPLWHHCNHCSLVLYQEVQLKGQHSLKQIKPNHSFNHEQIFKKNEMQNTHFDFTQWLCHLFCRVAYTLSDVWYKYTRNPLQCTENKYITMQGGRASCITNKTQGWF